MIIRESEESGDVGSLQRDAVWYESRGERDRRCDAVADDALKAAMDGNKHAWGAAEGSGQHGWRRWKSGG